MYDNDIKEEGIMAIQSSTVLRNLVRLDINHNDIKEIGAQMLALTSTMT
jgi:hypothetical protein